MDCYSFHQNPDTIIDKSEDAQLQAALKASLEMTSSRITRNVTVIDDNDEDGNTTDNFTADENEIASDEMELISGSEESEEDLSNCNKKRKIDGNLQGKKFLFITFHSIY